MDGHDLSYKAHQMSWTFDKKDKGDVVVAIHFRREAIPSPYKSPARQSTSAVISEWAYA